MREFIEGFKEMYREIFAFFYLSEREAGKLFACLSLTIICTLLIILIFNICRHLGRLEARKAYTVEIYSEQNYAK